MSLSEPKSSISCSLWRFVAVCTAQKIIAEQVATIKSIPAHGKRPVAHSTRDSHGASPSPRRKSSGNARAIGSILETASTPFHNLNQSSPGLTQNTNPTANNATEGAIAGPSPRSSPPTSPSP
eukprot:CAMPEP_0174884618 /NCGR_PEP_ID=MMETSP0167-20121228/59_1 /TAXON_ID=38298 /ORGANISM="Rhodella maculata, Strain CCMP736" /LENGTH=122 /DNA_ID=CAMNT_0016120029 /DNA_START=142 /DNA_END=507 /DNA_ORIENTATION=-